MLRIGTSGLELPHRQGHLERRLLPAAKRGRGSSVRGLRRALLLRRALRHRGSELQLLRAAAARGEPGLGGADAGGFRVLDQAAPAVHASEDVPAVALGDLPDATPEALAELSRVTRPTWIASRTASTPSRTRGKLGALLAQFPPSFHDTPANRELPGVAARHLPGLSSGRRAAAQVVERRWARRWSC